MCSNNQSFKPVQSPKVNVEKDEKDKDEKDIITQETETEDIEEKVSALNGFELLPIFKGFNIIQVFCCKDMINMLTDRGDVYCSLFEDLELHQKQVLLNKNIIKITGCASTNKCVAMSASGDLFEWSMITESLDTNTEDPVDDQANDANKSDENEDNSENSSVVNSISEPIQLTEIDQKVMDVAITSTAYCAVTCDGMLIIWGDFDKIYSAKNEKGKNKKKSKKSVQNYQNSVEVGR